MWLGHMPRYHILGLRHFLNFFPNLINFNLIAINLTAIKLASI